MKPLTLILLVAAVSGFTQDSVPARTLNRLKEATVFVKSDGSRWRGTGSGFVMKTIRNKAYVVTNEHVVSHQGETAARITLVFNSGTSKERTAVATIVGKDKSRDLAILEVTMSNPPKPILLKSKSKLRETLPVYMLGFPFGESLSRSRGNPAVTVGRGSISSIRRDEYGKIARIQIDGDLNPGNSGGPVVDSKGRLIGVAVSTYMGTQISLAIPPEELHEMMEGRVAGITFNQFQDKNLAVRLEVTLPLIDPMKKMKRVSVLMIRSDLVKTKPKADEKGIWEALARAKVTPMKIKDRVASGKIVLKSSKGGTVPYTFQTKYTRGDGKTIFTQPSQVRVRFSEAVAKKPDKPGKKDDDDWLGSDSDNKKRKAADAGKPLETGDVLLGDSRTVVDAKVTDIRVNAATTIANMQLTKDGKTLYTLEERGLVRKISVPEFKEERQFDLKAKCSWLALSKEGLLVVVRDLQELLVLDPKTLKVKRKIAIAGVGVVATSPKLSIAFGGSGRDELLVIDLKKGKVVERHSARQIQRDQGGQIRRHKDGVVLSDFRFPTVTPDGKYLFCVGFECLHRFKINGTDLDYEEMGPRIAQNGQRLEISADSKYVALPSGGGNYRVNDHPKMSYGTYIYKVTDLQLPVMSIESGAYPRALGFDKKAGKLYAQNHSFQLITFTPRGAKQKEYKLPGHSSTIKQIMAHPDGHKVLVLSAGALSWVELPE